MSAWQVFVFVYQRAQNAQIYMIAFGLRGSLSRILQFRNFYQNKDSLESLNII